MALMGNPVLLPPPHASRLPRLTGCWQARLHRCVPVYNDGMWVTVAQQFPFPSVVQRVQQLTLEAASQGAADPPVAAEEVVAQPAVKVEVKQEDKKECAPPPIKKLKLKRSLSKPA